MWIKSSFSALVACLAMAGPAAAQAQQASPAPKLQPYRINPGDELEVYVWGEDRLQRAIKVLPDGTFSFPLVGQVDAMNKLPREVEQELSRGLRSQYRDAVPQVTVSVKATSGLQFSVAGRVKAPGAFVPGRYVNVLEALALAGGPTEFADVGNIRILRKSGSSIVVMRVRLTDILRGNSTERDLSSLPQLESGDTVIVP